MKEREWEWHLLEKDNEAIVQFSSQTTYQLIVNECVALHTCLMIKRYLKSSEMVNKWLKQRFLLVNFHNRPFNWNFNWNDKKKKLMNCNSKIFNTVTQWYFSSFARKQIILLFIWLRHLTPIRVSHSRSSAYLFVLRWRPLLLIFT